MIFQREMPSPSTPLLKHLAAMICVIFVVFNAVSARAASLIRDPDIEYALAQLANPILTSAGLGRNVRILVVNDRSLNAFVVDSQHIFIHSGMILKMDSPEMLQAVIAHEAAHIANGHITRRLGNLGAAKTAAAFGLAVAALAAATTGNSEAAAGIAIGTQSAAQRQFLAHTRAEESSADQSGVRYMARANIDPKGAIAVHDLFSWTRIAERVAPRPLYALPPANSGSQTRHGRVCCGIWRESQTPTLSRLLVCPSQG